MTRLRPRFNFSQYTNGQLMLGAIVFLTIVFLVLGVLFTALQTLMTPTPTLLTDPFLQLPTPHSVRVVWFTEFAGIEHTVSYGPDLTQTAIANTTQLSRVREDQRSKVGEQTEERQVYQHPVVRNIWRHEAEVSGLAGGDRLPYRVTSIREDGEVIRSRDFLLAPLPPKGTPLQILLTSDHQLMPMTPTNLQKVAETVGQVDAVFLAGDLVNIPDRASEWFDDNRGGAFFPSLQGRAHYQLERNGSTTRYQGAAIIQNAPLFPAIGNHEVMGRFSSNKDLNEQFNDPYPLAAAATLYQQKALTLNPDNDPVVAAEWLKDNSFNTDTYEEIFTLPETRAGGKKYYAVTVGDVRLVVLFVTNIWRVPSLEADAKGRYRERAADLNAPERWGYGQHIFEPIVPGSPQYEWLQAELQSSDFQQAPYKVVMFHHPPHSLGDNIVPAYTNPVQTIERDANGQVTSVRYEYPQDQDFLMRHVVPLLDAAGVSLVYYGHSHLWNRFTSSSGMHFLESSNVGNTYGAYVGDKRRPVPSDFAETYAATDDPNGLQPIVPAIAPLMNDQNQPLPYIASNDITVFSILDTATATVKSYRFDTRAPNATVVKFDEFRLAR